MTFWDWIETTKPEGALTAIVAAAIGLATWRIAWVQKEIAKEKVISDLFDRRYKAYEATLRIIMAFIRMNRETSVEIITELLAEYTYTHYQIPMLFGEDIVKINEKITDNFFEYRDIFEEFVKNDGSGVSVDVHLGKKLDEKKETLKEDVEELSTAIGKYLKVKDFRTS